MANITYSATPGLGGSFGNAIPLVGLVIPWKNVDVTYDCQGYFNHIKAKPGMGGGFGYGHPKDYHYQASPGIGGSIGSGTPILGVVWSDSKGSGGSYGVITGYGINLIANKASGAEEGEPTPGGGGGPFVQVPWSNWIYTSHIGSFTFYRDDTGEVRNFPMLWGGVIYRIEKLGSSGVVVYGNNGITFCSRHVTHWSNIKQLLKVGIKGRGAVCVTENSREHLFIDSIGFLWKLVEGSEPKSRDYSVYLANLNSNVRMNYDYEENVIYICDGINGYVLSEWGLGEGPANISGIGTKYGNFYSVGPSQITTLPMNICTDIMDFKIRTEKTIHEIDIGISLKGDLYGAIDYRWRTNQNFFTTPWVKADRTGRIFITASGVEFRIKLKQSIWENVQLDYEDIHVKYDESKPIGGDIQP